MTEEREDVSYSGAGKGKKQERIIGKGKMMWRRWEVGIDDDLTREERRIR